MTTPLCPISERQSNIEWPPFKTSTCDVHSPSNLFIKLFSRLNSLKCKYVDANFERNCFYCDLSFRRITSADGIRTGCARTWSSSRKVYDGWQQKQRPARYHRSRYLFLIRLSGSIGFHWDRPAAKQKQKNPEKKGKSGKIVATSATNRPLNEWQTVQFPTGRDIFLLFQKQNPRHPQTVTSGGGIFLSSVRPQTCPFYLLWPKLDDLFPDSSGPFFYFHWKGHISLQELLLPLGFSFTLRWLDFSLWSLPKLEFRSETEKKSTQQNKRREREREKYIK